MSQKDIRDVHVQFIQTKNTKCYLIKMLRT